MSKRKEITLSEFLASNESIQLAICEAVHRYFHEHCFTDGEGSRLKTDVGTAQVNNLYKNLSCLYPDWRYRLKRKLERYFGWEKTNAIHIEGKPTEVIDDPIKFCIRLIADEK